MQQQPIIDTPRENQRRGNPTGTHFVIGALVVLLVMVGIYFMSMNANEVNNSPLVNRATEGNAAGSTPATGQNAEGTTAGTAGSVNSRSTPSATE